MNNFSIVVFGGLLSFLMIGPLVNANDPENRTCGDHVTLKVPVGPDKAKVATVVLGMSTQDVMTLFQPASDQWNEDHGILYDSIDDDGKLLLTFSATDGNSADGRKLDKLSEVMYRPGGQKEMHFLLPRGKRGTPIPAKYRTLLQKDKKDAGLPPMAIGIPNTGR